MLLTNNVTSLISQLNYGSLDLLIGCLLHFESAKTSDLICQYFIFNFTYFLNIWQYFELIVQTSVLNLQDLKKHNIDININTMLCKIPQIEVRQFAEYCIFGIKVANIDQGLHRSGVNIHSGHWVKFYTENTLIYILNLHILIFDTSG